MPAQLPTDDEVNGEILPADPISRLEAEIERTERPDGATSSDEGERLLEETWSLFTECMVIRDGLLEACEEIERTMGGLQRKLGTLPVAIPPGSAPLAINGVADGHTTNGLATNANGNGNGAHGSSTSANGHVDANVNGHSNGANPV